MVSEKSEPNTRTPGLFSSRDTPLRLLRVDIRISPRCRLPPSSYSYIISSKSDRREFRYGSPCAQRSSAKAYLARQLLRKTALQALISYHRGDGEGEMESQRKVHNTSPAMNDACRQTLILVNAITT